MSGSPSPSSSTCRPTPSESSTLATCYGGHDADLLVAVERGVEAVARAHVAPVDVDVDEVAQLPGLVEEQVGDGQRAECGAHGRRLDLEGVPAAGLTREQSRQSNRYCHSPTSTERIAGRWRAASIHSSPVLGET